MICFHSTFSRAFFFLDSVVDPDPVEACSDLDPKINLGFFFYTLNCVAFNDLKFKYLCG